MKAIEVQFKKVGKKYYFSPGAYQIHNGDYVVVETIRGIELGRAVSDIKDIPDQKLVSELKPIIRIASLKDLNDNESNHAMQKKCMEKIKMQIRKNKLDMKLLGCEYTLDRSKLIIYFESESRVDFRQLVKDLADDFKVRIELRQVGSRDGAKFIGGLGPCGLIMCCMTHIGEFDNVSIKMAKNQNLSLNPQKISGTCGKLLCCIKFEDETYTELRKNMPDVGDYVTTEVGRGKVLSSDVLNKVFKVKYNEDSYAFITAEDIISIEKRRRKEDNPQKEAQSLKGLE